MATKTYAVGDPETVKLWSKRVAREALKKTQCFKYMKESSDALGTIETDTQKGAGDRVTVTLRLQGTGDGVTENETQEGNEEAIVTYTDNVLINELSHAFRSNKTISQQRVPFKLGFEMNDALSDWWAARMDYIFFAQLAGYTPANLLAGANGKYSGFNTITAPSSGRQLWTEVGATQDSDLDSSGDEMTLAQIDRAVELAQTGGSNGLIPIRPIAGLPGGAEYVCFVHPAQTTSLRTSTTALNWADLQKALLQGGEGEASKFWKGGLGVYNKTLLVESTRVPQGVTAGNVAISTVRRAIFCGAQALGVAFGSGYGPEEWKVKEETFDYGRQLGVNGLNIFGMKKHVYNSSDFATIVISSYAANAA